MYLHRIDLHGFKSFADRTQVQFDPGVTAIVGPNGCGKSNIIDAVRWVLGEQRARLLRSEKMESVIFNGTSTRRSLGMAEVSLTIHNTRGVLPIEYSEVTIGRRLFRSGESEYVLNGTTCRLKDILDLFMDTGMGPGAYSVIELKMIEDLLSENPQDRRRMFEEAAGITKYKLRRTQALRRLDQTQTDLDRLRDITEEVGRQVRSLERQAKKAERYRELADLVRTLELQLAAADHHRLTNERQAVEAEARRLEEQLAERTAQLQTREADTEAQRTELVTRERALADAQKALNDHISRIREVEAEARLAAERESSATAALERMEREAGLDAERLAKARGEIDELQNQVEAAKQELAEAEETEKARAAELSDAQAEAAHARGLLARADAAGVEAVAMQRRAEGELETRRSRHAVLDEERARVEERLAEAERLQGEVQQRLVQAEEVSEAAAAGVKQAEEALRQAEAKRRDLDRQIEETREQLATARRQYDAAAAEIEVLESLLDSHEGFPESVRALLDEPAWATSPRTVSDILEPPSHLRRAVGAALGPYADCLVVNSEAEALAGVQRLRSSDSGRATFLVLDRLPERGPQVLSPTPPGTTPLAEGLSRDGLEARLGRALLSNCFLVPSLEEAEGLLSSYPVARFVTPAGEWAGGGLLRAGAAERTTQSERIGRREQLEAAQTAKVTAATGAKSIEERLRSLVATREELAIDSLRSALDVRQKELSQAARAADLARSNAEAEARNRRELGSRLTDLLGQLQESVDVGDLEAAVNTAKGSLERADAARAAATEALAKAENVARGKLERSSEARVVAAAARNRLETVQRDLDRAQATVTEIQTGQRRREQDRIGVAQTREEARDQQKRLAEQSTSLNDALEGFQTAAQAAENALLEARAGISDVETLLRELRRLREDARERLSAAQLRLAEIQARTEGLEERIWTEYEVSVPEIEPPDEDFDPAGVRAELPELRRQLRNLGAVNELALESYDEQKERLDFMLEQQRDLEEAESSLRSTIKEINATASERFEKTFSEVREAFQKLFVELFGENAMADLILDGDDPLEDEILIRARPKGKKPSAITQLSGGEKTLTAIALLFAIYLVKPSPFCILDEVDAPLDDANVERFMRLIRSFSDSTQFILVTHNKLTMEAADRMYGVTMQEEGVSRLVGVRFAEVLPAAA